MIDQAWQSQPFKAQSFTDIPGAFGSGPNTSASATGDGAFAIGTAASASQRASTALGNGATASNQSAIAIGDRATASQFGDAALGLRANASGGLSIALGVGAAAANTAAIALGSSASALGQESVALGASSVANKSATALGVGAKAGFEPSTAIGTQATTIRTDQIVLGTSATGVTVSKLAGTNQEVVYAKDDGTLARASGLSITNDGSLITNDLTISGDKILSETVTLNNFKQSNDAITTDILSTDADGNLIKISLPTTTSGEDPTFCITSGGDSSCFGSDAKAKGAKDTAIGTNSKADAINGSTGSTAWVLTPRPSVMAPRHWAVAQKLMVKALLPLVKVPDRQQPVVSLLVIKPLQMALMRWPMAQVR